MTLYFVRRGIQGLVDYSEFDFVNVFMNTLNMVSVWFVTCKVSPRRWPSTEREVLPSDCCPWQALCSWWWATREPPGRFELEQREKPFCCSDFWIGLDGKKKSPSTLVQEPHCRWGSKTIENENYDRFVFSTGEYWTSIDWGGKKQPFPLVQERHCRCCCCCCSLLPHPPPLL